MFLAFLNPVVSDKQVLQKQLSLMTSLHEVPNIPRVAEWS